MTITQLKKIGFEKIGFYEWKDGECAVDHRFSNPKKKIDIVYLLCSGKSIMYVGRADSYHRALDYHKMESRDRNVRNGVAEICKSGGTVDVYARIGRKLMIDGIETIDTYSLEMGLIKLISDPWNTYGIK